jgi:hypothetical protein
VLLLGGGGNFAPEHLRYRLVPKFPRITLDRAISVLHLRSFIEKKKRKWNIKNVPPTGIKMVQNIVTRFDLIFFKT